MENKAFEFKQKLKTAVLFLVFNRIDTTKQSFEEIRKVRPPMLYIAADGSRKDMDGEVAIVKEVRDYVLNNIDWPCEVKTLFRDVNLGCGRAVSEAITWFFENEEMGIILEDDCVPSQSFFYFCEMLLGKYKDDQRIMHIGGTNFQDGIIRGDGSYYFSKMYHHWGWAGWRRAWKYFDFKMEHFPKFKELNEISNIWHDKETQNYFIKIFQDVYDGRVDTWDYQCYYAYYLQNGLAIIPNVNMVSNVGIVGTHHDGKPDRCINMNRFDIGEISHPYFIIGDYNADAYFYDKHIKLKMNFKNLVRYILDNIPFGIGVYIKAIYKKYKT